MSKKPATIAKSVIKNTIAPEVMAQAIVDIAQAMRALSGSKLSRRAITLLIQADCRVSIENINRVLDAALNLDKTYLK